MNKAFAFMILLKPMSQAEVEFTSLAVNWYRFFLLTSSFIASIRIGLDFWNFTTVVFYM